MKTKQYSIINDAISQLLVLPELLPHLDVTFTEHQLEVTQVIYFSSLTYMHKITLTSLI